MSRSNRNHIIDKAFQAFAIFCTVFGVLSLLLFLGNICYNGIARIDWQFMTSLPSRLPAKAGIISALVGTLWILVLTTVIAVPIGIGAGIYLEEYTKKNRLQDFFEINITNLAGVPSIIYGLLGLEVFARLMHMGGSILAGACTLSLLILPVIIVATRESLKAVPKSLREASYALGATKWQTIRMQILPAASGGIVTGIILSLARAIGETAPLIVVGALAYVPFIPTSPTDEFTVMPIQIFNWISRPQKGFAINAAAAIIILLLITFVMNGVALYFRNKWQKKVKW